VDGCRETGLVARWRPMAAELQTQRLRLGRGATTTSTSTPRSSASETNVRQPSIMTDSARLKASHGGRPSSRRQTGPGHA